MENMTEKETEKADKYELMSDGIVAESKNLLTNELDVTNIYRRDELHRFSDERRIIWES